MPAFKGTKIIRDSSRNPYVGALRSLFSEAHTTFISPARYMAIFLAFVWVQHGKIVRGVVKTAFTRPSEQVFMGTR